MPASTRNNDQPITPDPKEDGKPGDTFLYAQMVGEYNLRVAGHSHSPLFTDDSRRVHLEALGIDEATLARSRGAAVNQACAALPYYLNTYPEIVERSWHKLAALGVPPVSRRVHGS